MSKMSHISDEFFIESPIKVKHTMKCCDNGGNALINETLSDVTPHMYTTAYLKGTWEY